LGHERAATRVTPVDELFGLADEKYAVHYAGIAFNW